MLISLNKIKQYVKIPDSVTNEELLELISSRLVEIEEVTDWAPRYKNIYIAKVVSCEPIPETHLSLCQIDAGEHNSEYNTLDNGLIQVVCGAPNVHAGMLAVWIAPGVIVPSTYGNENFKLSVRKLRGYESNGMLAGADELGFDNEHKSIAEIDPKTAKPGDSLAEVFDLNDLIIDVENKSLTHRPDCFGLIGFAREVAGILGEKFIEPEVFADLGHEILATKSDLKLSVKIADAELCLRYSAAVFDLSDNTPSKYLTKDAVFLAKSGMRAIDPMVDLTNIVMLETGQPLHAFDYDKFIAVGGSKTPEVVVRAAKDGEELQLLDGKVIQCNPEDILITSNQVPVALAGAMGGKNTEVDASTKRIVLESATFSLYHLRKTQMAHGIFSEAITRFTKGQPAPMTLVVLDETIRRLGVEPLVMVDEYPGKVSEVVVKITTDEINQLLGSSYDVDTITRTLENVGFKVGKSVCESSNLSFEGSKTRASAPERPEKDKGELCLPSCQLEIVAPAWRTDIHIKEDIIEEVGRLLGYDNLPISLPEKPFIESEVDSTVRLKTELREILSARLCMHEVLTYSFISRSLLEKVGLDVENSYKITNSISPELQCFRQQITPSLLDKVRENLKSGYRDFTLYEMNQVSQKSSGLTAEKTPVTNTHLGIVCLGDFYQLKAQVLALFRELKMPVEYTNLSAESAKHDTYLEPKRSAELLVDGVKIGAFGEVKSSVLRKFKLESVVSAAEFNLEKIVDIPRVQKKDLKFSKFPYVERDLTLKVAASIEFGRVAKALDGCLSGQDLYYTVSPVSIYQATEDAETKNLSFHLKFSDPTKTLNSAEISAIMENITIAVASVGAVVV